MLASPLAWGRQRLSEQQRGWTALFTACSGHTLSFLASGQTVPLKVPLRQPPRQPTKGRDAAKAACPHPGPSAGWLQAQDFSEGKRCQLGTF